jgi:hypothetical protein
MSSTEFGKKEFGNEKPINTVGNDALRYGFLDIETLPSQDPVIRALIGKDVQPPSNYKNIDTIRKWERDVRPGLIEEKLLKTALNGGLGRVFCISIAVNDEAVETFSAESMTEREMLNNFFG